MDIEKTENLGKKLNRNPRRKARVKGNVSKKKDGDARTALHKKDLDAQYGAARILSQKHLRNKKGEIVSDPLTGESRKLDLVIKGAGKNGGGHAQEVTSKNASKSSQLAKEERIRGWSMSEMAKAWFMLTEYPKLLDYFRRLSWI